MNSHRKFAIVAMSTALAVIAMLWWLHNFDVSGQEFAILLLRLHWWIVPPLFALLAGHVALSTWRWSIIEVALGGSKPSFGPAFATGAVALGLGTFLPSPIITVACRGFANRIRGSSGSRGALSGAVDQAADLAVVVLMALPAGLAFVRRDITIYLAGVPLMVLVGLLGLLLMPKLLCIIRLPPWLARLDGVASPAIRPLLLKLYGISLTRVANLTLMTLAIWAATGAASVNALVIAVPLVTLAISAAMLPGAFGISEWSFSAVLLGMGIERREIILFVLANRIILTALSLLLAIFVGIVLANVSLIKREGTTKEPA